MNIHVYIGNFKVKTSRKLKKKILMANLSILME